MKSSIQRILVPLYPSQFAQAATETACRIAQKHEAQVAGVAVLDSAGISSDLSPAVGPYLPGVAEEVSKKLQHADQVARDCMTQFSDACDAAGIPHWETEYEGIPSEKLLESSIFSDLIVIGLRTSFHFETRGTGEEHDLDRILDRTITPVLAVPIGGIAEIETVVLAFDGSLGAAGAMHDFAGAGSVFDPAVKIIVAEKPQAESEFLLNQAASYLRSHGFSSIETLPTDAPVIEAVEAENADLIVAGIHSRKFIKDLFVGSLVRHFVKRGDTALFLSH